MLNVSGIAKIVSTAGAAILKSLRSISTADCIMKMPTITRAGAVAAAGTLRAGPRGAGALRESLAVPERQMILEALQRHAWRRDAAARALGINRTTLYKKAKRLGLDLSTLPAGG